VNDTDTHARKPVHEPPPSANHGKVENESVQSIISQDFSREDNIFKGFLRGRTSVLAQ